MAGSQETQSNDQEEENSDKDHVCSEWTNKVKNAEEAHEEREESKGGVEFCNIGAVGCTGVIIRRKGSREA